MSDEMFVDRAAQPFDWLELLDDMTLDYCPKHLIDQMYNRPLPERIPVVTVAVCDYWDEVRGGVAHFEDSDWDIVVGMVDLFLTTPDVLPPVVVREKFLLDGFHRMFALKMCGITHWLAVDLDSLIDHMLSVKLSLEVEE